jgi:G3E family GTPase
VTGFLGTGKTTFIGRSLLPALAGRRFALLVNDFGEVGFDGRLFRKDGLDVIEVEGGCICCSAGAEVTAALARVRETLAPEILVVEGSGVADPYPLIEALETEGFHLEGVACLIDPGNLEACRRHAVFAHQVEVANLFVLAKCDMASPAEIAAAHAHLRAAKGGPIGVWHAEDGVAPDGFLACLADVRASPARHRHHHSATGYSSLVLRPEGGFRKAEFLRFLAHLPSSVLRLKGICQFVDSPTPLAVNWSFGHTAFTRWERDDAPFLLAIGHDLDPEALARSLPRAEPFDYGGVADGEMLPEGGFDGRPGAAYLEGRAAPELAVAEAVLDLVRRGTATLVADRRRTTGDELAAVASAFAEIRTVESYRYPDLLRLADELARGGGPVVYLSMLSAAAALCAERCGRPSVLLTDAYAIPGAHASIGGLRGERRTALLSCMGAQP